MMKSPISTDHSPLSTDHSPQSTGHSPLTTDHSPLTTDHSPLSTDHWPLTTGHWPLSTVRAGFTLIEILVATTILLVIIILASLVFQQTTGAYQTGERKVGAQVALRNVVGAMTRDVALAVDSCDYPGVSDNNFGSGSMSFVALVGAPGRNASGEEGASYRTARIVKYTSDGKRVETPLKYARDRKGNPPKWTAAGETETTTLFDKDSYDDIKAGSFRMDFDYDWPDDSEAKLPERVYIRVELEEDSRTVAVGAGSGGRRGWGSDDEIWVGVKPRD